jgi:hypothetical protein
MVSADFQSTTLLCLIHTQVIPDLVRCNIVMKVKSHFQVPPCTGYCISGDQFWCRLRPPGLFLTRICTFFVTLPSREVDFVCCVGRLATFVSSESLIPRLALARASVRIRSGGAKHVLIIIEVSLCRS